MPIVVPPPQQGQNMVWLPKHRPVPWVDWTWRSENALASPSNLNSLNRQPLREASVSIFSKPGF
jgi:hypothetical protein